MAYPSQWDTNDIFGDWMCFIAELQYKHFELQEYKQIDGSLKQNNCA